MAKKKQVKKVEEMPKKKIEFSKLVIMFVMMTYFLVVALGIFLCVRRNASLFETLCHFVAPSIVTALGFYYTKAGVENYKKIDSSK